MPPPSQQPRILLIFNLLWDDSKAMLLGIAQFAQGAWDVTIDVDGAAIEDESWIAGHTWDGVITRHASDQLRTQCAERLIPLIDLDDQPPVPGMAKVRHDNRSVGHMGAEHFLERGFKHFAFCGLGHSWSRERHAGYQEALRLTGHDCVLLEAPYGDFDPDWNEEQHAIIAEWLRELPQPLAVMACNDLRALQVTHACREAGFLVPNEVAVLGVNNDSLRCAFGSPPLSSVATDRQLVGYRAAELLDRLMKTGKLGHGEELSIEPLRVVVRRSTDVFAVDDKHVCEALHFIMERACDGISAADVATRIGLSRFALERKFKQWVGRSPHTEICSVRIARIKQLLTETDMPLKNIAELVGVPHTEYLSVMFRRDVGVAPGAFRRQHQPRSGANPVFSQPNTDDDQEI